MSNYSLFTQLGMIGVAVAILFVYIKPTYTAIQTTLDTTQTYLEEADKVKKVDDLLTEKVSKVDAVSAADMAALKRYVPDSVDDVLVMKDLQAIFAALAFPLEGLTAGGAGAATAQPGVLGGAGLVPHTFSLSTKVSYDDLKTLLKVLEANNYLLQVNSLSLAPSDSGLIGVSMSLATFSRATTTAKAVAVGEEPL